MNHHFKTALWSALLVGLVLSLTSGAQAADVRQIGWDDLLPPLQPYDDPFAELSTDQLRDLRTLILPENAGDQSEKLHVNEARARLEAAGLDIDYLARQRELIIARRTEAATATNPEVVGAAVRMPGYVLPLRTEARKITEFLLVPYVGACIHVPPPPPNQVVHVIYSPGIEIDGLYAPVWINGTLQSDAQQVQLSFVDGRALVSSSYKIEPTSLEPYTP